MKKQDIIMYGSSELSLLFQNEETLYNEYMRAVRTGNFNYLNEVANEYFIFTPEQLEELEEDFKAECEENQ